MRATLFLLLSFPSVVFAHECENWEYAVFYLTYDHDGDAHQQWEHGGKKFNWLNGEVKQVRENVVNDAKVSMWKHFELKRKVLHRIDNLDAIGNQGWELVTEKMSLENTSTSYFKRCK